MISTKILSNFNRLSLQPHNIIRNFNVTATLNFHISDNCFAEPLKKKKRIDPAVVKAREERKKKKIEKQIKRLEKNAQQLKPLIECDIPLEILDERDKRQRVLTTIAVETLENWALLEKRWAKYKQDQHLADIKMLDRITYSQQKALDELRAESEDLYQSAIQLDLQLIPFKSEGPTQTPAIDNYDSPDGEYLDVSKKWE